MGNKLLDALPPDDYTRLEPLLERVSLPARQVLHSPGEPIQVVYFPADGLCSIVMTMEDGRMAEVATVGNEGMVGISTFLCGDRPPSQTIVQVSGAFAYAMAADLFVQEMERRGALYDLVCRYSQALMTFVMQSAACNGLHRADQRCARWLLQTHDRLGRDQFELTQEFLSIMLGVRRATVSLIAHELQRAGLIVFTRRLITIVDRSGLEEATCECYGAIKGEFDRLLP